MKIFIAEDDAFISDDLNEILLELGHEVVGIGFNLESSIKILENSTPELVILDINMHGKEQGFDIAERVNAKYQVPIIFLTSFSDQDTVKKAVSFSPEGYIVKPFNQADIYTAIEVVKSKLEQKEPYVTIKDGRDQVRIKVNEIQFIKSDDKYIEIHTGHHRYIERNSLSQFLDQLPKEQFLKSHRAYAVNTSCIDRTSGNQLFIKGKAVPLSRSYKKAIIEKMNVQ